MLCHNVPSNGLIPSRSTHNLWAKFSFLPSEQPKWDAAHCLDCSAQEEVTVPWPPTRTAATVPHWPAPLHASPVAMVHPPHSCQGDPHKSQIVLLLCTKTFNGFHTGFPGYATILTLAARPHIIRTQNFLLLSSQWSLCSSHTGLPAGLQTLQASPSHPSPGVFSAAGAQTALERFLKGLLSESFLKPLLKAPPSQTPVLGRSLLPFFHRACHHVILGIYVLSTASTRMSAP